MTKHRKYTNELRLKAVKIFLEGEKSAAVIAKELSISNGRQISLWVSVYREHGEKGFKDNRGIHLGKYVGKRKKNFKTIEEEVEYLRAKVDLLEAVVNFEVKKK